MWGAAVLLGAAGMVRYQMQPGVATQVVANRWPSPPGISLDPNLLTLVMVLHPQCPCSQATLHELTQVIGKYNNRIAINILFVQPPNAPANWVEGGLYDSVRQLSNVNVVVDKDGKAASALGATTSGQVIIFEPGGRVLFDGGITDGRGHEGDNPGLDTVFEVIRSGATSIRTAPVFGCSLGLGSVNSREKN
jgi:hypothetical protein